MVEKRISRRLGLGFEICCAFVRGQVEVARQIHNIIISNRQQLTQQSHKYKLVIIRTIGILQLEHPNIALSVKTKLALLNVLSAQHEGVEQLKAEGVLSVSDCELLIKRLEETVKKLSTRPPRVEDNTVDNIISNISWVHGDSELFHYLKDGREDLRLRANSILIDENTHNHDIYVIQSGVIRLETSEMQRRCPIDFLTAGNIIGEINFLTKQPNRKLARCETALTAIVFREEMLKTALKIDWGLDLPPLLYRMWLTLAKRVAVTVFMKEPHFERMSKERILAHLADAYIVDASESNIIDINQGIQDIVLVHGHAIDNITRQPMKGPCYVPTTTVQLKLQPEKGLYTLVLLVPQGNPPLLTYALEPTGQRIRLDSNALMTSTSMEGLDLKQFEITNVRDSIDQRQSFDINNDEFGISKSENEASSDQLLEDEHVVASSSADDLNISITDRSGRFSRKDTAATRNEEMSRSMESSRDPTRPSLQSTMSEDTPHSRSLQDSVNKEEGETKPAVKSDSK
ncbi:sodium/hydrogen exchanger 11-like [Pomacea canaliculata]|nr:sodium/hydrogen exchanger 11-like [Pomacea canaliculata]